MHSNRIKSTKIQQKVHSRTFILFPEVYVFIFFYFSIFTLCTNVCFKLIQIAFVCEVSRQKNENCYLRKKKKNLSSRFFKVPWQQNIQKNFDENSRQREADYKGDNLLLQLQELQSLIAHIHKHCVVFFIWTSVQKHCSFLSYHGPSVRG